jgi:hypothetical protein
VTQWINQLVESYGLGLLFGAVRRPDDPAVPLDERAAAGAAERAEEGA